MIRQCLLDEIGMNVTLKIHECIIQSNEFQSKKNNDFYLLVRYSFLHILHICVNVTWSKAFTWLIGHIENMWKISFKRSFAIIDAGEIFLKGQILIKHNFSCVKYSPMYLRWQGSLGKHGAHLGPVGPRWAPCRPHEPCYQGLHCSYYYDMAVNHPANGLDDIDLYHTITERD